MIKAIAIILAGLALGMIFFQKKPRPAPTPTQTPTWQEQPVILTDIETATMSGDFTQEYLLSIKQSPTPTPQLFSDVPSSMAGDIMAPTVTISGEPPCFSLWVSDNMTPWQQLVTRSKLDDGQWGSWMNYFSYCFDNLGNGDHTVSIQIKDLAGNISSEVKRTFIVKR